MRLKRKQIRYRRFAFILLLVVFILGALIYRYISNKYNLDRLKLLNRYYRFIPSPNYDQRTGGCVDCIVFHATATDRLNPVINEFKNKRSELSAHYIVGKDGTIVQMVPLECRAWHAGVSSYNGKRNVNDFSIGIELVNLNDGKDKYTDAQYRSLVKIIHQIRSKCEISNDHIVSHANIAIPYGRKSDPAGFDWKKFYTLLDDAQ